MASDEDRAYASALERPTYSDDVELRERAVRPDVPEDVDDERKRFIDDHFHDPNFDLRSKPPSFLSVDEKKSKYDSDGNSIISSRNSSMMGFDEYAPFLCLHRPFSHRPANRPTPRSAQQSQQLTTQKCPSTPSECMLCSDP